MKVKINSTVNETDFGKLYRGDYFRLPDSDDVFLVTDNLDTAVSIASGIQYKFGTDKQVVPLQADEFTFTEEK